MASAASSYGRSRSTPSRRSRARYFGLLAKSGCCQRLSPSPRPLRRGLCEPLPFPLLLGPVLARVVSSDSVGGPGAAPAEGLRRARRAILRRPVLDLAVSSAPKINDRRFNPQPTEPCSVTNCHGRERTLLPSAKNRRTVGASRQAPKRLSREGTRAPTTEGGESRGAAQQSKGPGLLGWVGPAGAGKTSLAEAMLFAAGATDRLGSTANGSSIGDSSPESRQRGGSTELNLYHFQYLGDDFAVVDVPGSVGFSADGAKALAIADVAILVVDPDPARAPLAAPALRALDELGIPHLVFVNRIDQAHGRIRDLLSALQPMSVSPLIGRQIPIWDGEKISGFVDLALEYAFKYRAGQESERIDIPESLQAREAEARTHMLEQLADHDDELLEQLLMDESPAREKVLNDLARETGDNLGVSVLFGSAISSWGVRRLLKAMRHEAPDAEAATDRLGVTDPALYVFKVVHGSIGRLAIARALGGRIGEGSDLKIDDGAHARVGSLFNVQGEKTIKVGGASSGDVVAVAKIDSVKAGQWVGSGKLPPPIEIDYPARNCAIAIEPADRKDDVKLSGALQRLGEEDAALIIEHDEANHEIRLRGVNDEHLNTVIARLKRRYGVEVKSHAPTVAISP